MITESFHTSPGPSPGQVPIVEAFDARLGAPGFAWSGRVVARFETAALAEREERSAPGASPAASPAGSPRFLTLLGPGRPLVPWSLRLAAGLDRLEPDLSLRVEDATVWLGRASLGAVLGPCSLVGCGHCLAATGHGAQRMTGTELARRLALLPLPRRALALLGQARPEGTPLERQCVTTAALGLETLLGALGSGHQAALGTAARRLSGLGPGSTPTGDDLLVGVAASAWTLCRAGLVADGILETFCRALRALPEEGTTPTAFEMLQEAAEGFFPAPLVELTGALTRPGASREALASPTAELLTLGRQSGADMLAGAVALADRAARNAAPVAREAS